MAYIGSACIGRYALYSCISTASLIDDRIPAGYRGEMVSACIKGLLNTNVYRRQAGIGDGIWKSVPGRYSHGNGINIVAQRIKYLYILRIPIIRTLTTYGAIAIQL